MIALQGDCSGETDGAGPHRDGVCGVARHHLKGRVGAPQVDLALPLPAAVRIAPLSLAQVVPAGVQPAMASWCDDGARSCCAHLSGTGVLPAACTCKSAHMIQARAHQSSNCPQGSSEKRLMWIMARPMSVWLPTTSVAPLMMFRLSSSCGTNELAWLQDGALSSQAHGEPTDRGQVF